MSVNIYDKDTQTLTEVAGTGTVEFGASTVRTGTVTIPAGTSGGRFSITYDSPMNDTDYVFDFQISYINSEDLNNNVNVLFNSKKTTGADLWIFGSPSDKIIINYTAFKLHTVEGLEELEAAVDSLQTVTNTKIVLDETSGAYLTLIKKGDIVCGQVSANTGATWNITANGIIAEIPTNYRPTTQTEVRFNVSSRVSGEWAIFRYYPNNDTVSLQVDATGGTLHVPSANFCYVM